MNYSQWLVLIISLPGQSGTPRMRVWRAMKARGAAVLRDGVYLLPDIGDIRNSLTEQVGSVQEAGGSAYLLEQAPADPAQAAGFQALFDRSGDYSEWLDKAAALRVDLPSLDEPEARRRQAQLHRDFESISAIDYFAGEQRDRARTALEQIAKDVNERLSPGEPAAIAGNIIPRKPGDFQRRRWATRQKLWVDRVASAWLIRRFIDPAARFTWLARPADCPADAVGFDFDGADFSHIHNYVTFEVLVHAFGLSQDAALAKLGELVHYLDVGGVPVAEAAGFVTMLGGARSTSENDDELLDSASALLDHLYTAYQVEIK